MTIAKQPPILTDEAGRKWRLIIPVGVYATLRDEHGIDLLAEDALANVMTDPVKRSEVLIAILDRQAAKHGLTPDDVDEMLCDPTTAPPAHVALEAALRGFYVTQGQTIMVEVMDRVLAAAKTLTNTATTRINSERMKMLMKRELDRASAKMDQEMDRMEAEQSANDSLVGSTNSLPPPVQPTGESSPSGSSAAATAPSASTAGSTPPGSSPH